MTLNGRYCLFDQTLYKMIVEKDSKVAHFFAGYDWLLIDVDDGVAVVFWKENGGELRPFW